MDAKLMKNGTTTYVLVKDGEVIGNMKNLSIKNCQAIERGYDLDELVEKEYPLVYESYKDGFKAGFQKALELNADKRFTLKEMTDCWNKALTFQTHKETLGEHIQSLQQKEWDVEIEMEFNPINHASGLQLTGNKLMDISISQNYKPKLDADGCLILKRK